jgi:hypothetical protein
VDEITTEVKLVQSAEPASGTQKPLPPSMPPSGGEAASDHGPAANGLPGRPNKRREERPEAQPGQDVVPVHSGPTRPPQAGTLPASAIAQAAEVVVEAALATAVMAGAGDASARCKLTVVLKSTGNADRDARRMRRVHGLLTSYPGEDRFAFHVHESSRQYLLEFPSFTTGLCDELVSQLQGILGENTVLVESVPV